MRTTLPGTVEFNRAKKYQTVKKLGQGACGETVCLYDNDLEIHIVAKKFSPIDHIKQDKLLFDGMLDRFRHEAKLLFSVNHPNIVRVYNFYDYRELGTSYILMEHVDGVDFLDFSRGNAALLVRAFEMLIDAFSHLESKGIIHRDIRPQNILVSEDGVPKIIDFGFGKMLSPSGSGVDKSISLNWWCDVPPEFDDGTYDHVTEIYFLGKLFELAIGDVDISEFKYKDLVKRMCNKDRLKRPDSFQYVKNEIASYRFSGLEFTSDELKKYRLFSSGLANCVASIAYESKYAEDVGEVIRKLEALYRETMLEKNIPDTTKLISILVKGKYTYFKNQTIEVKFVKGFIDIIKYSGKEKVSIILSNIYARLDALKKPAPSVINDDIPF